MADPIDLLERIGIPALTLYLLITTAPKIIDALTRLVVAVRRRNDQCHSSKNSEPPA